MPSQPAVRLEAPAGDALRLRPPTPADGTAMWRLAGRAGLDLNSPYAYVMWGEYHDATSVVAEDGSGLAGFVMGFRVPDEPTTVFVWQIAVGDEHRGRGLGGRLLDELVRRTGANTVEATVTPSNEASAALFRALGARHGGTALEDLVFPEALFPADHEAEIRFRIPVRSDHQQNHRRENEGLI